MVRGFTRFAEKQHGTATECPRCKKSVPGSASAPRDTVCGSCGLHFCFLHGLAHSAEETCDAYLQRLATTDVASQKALAKDGLQCPSCGLWVSKTGGCNHMTCRCGGQFCYLCGDNIAGRVGEHFNTSADSLTDCPGRQYGGGAPGSRRRTPEMIARAERTRASRESLRRCLRFVVIPLIPVLIILWFVLLIVIMALMTVILLPIVFVAICEDELKCCKMGNRALDAIDADRIDALVDFPEHLFAYCFGPDCCDC
jgi:hypothetical protein